MPARHPLRHQLLFSHLLVAAIGLAMLCIALLSTSELRTHVLRLSGEGRPLVEASLQVLAGVRQSLASLQGWVNLGDDSFRRDWQDAWRVEIAPALQALHVHGHLLEDLHKTHYLSELETRLAELRESQWWIMEVARTPGNEPARVHYLHRVEPIARVVESLADALLQKEGRRNGAGPPPLLLEFAQIRQALTAAHLALREMVGPAGLEYESGWREQVQRLRDHLAVVVAQRAALAPEQVEWLDRLQQELNAFEFYAGQLIEQRRSGLVNVARHRLQTETLPLAAQATRLATELAAQSNALMQREVRAARLSSNVAVWMLAVLIVTMMVVAFLVSQSRAARLARPLALLALATQALASGRLKSDIPVTRDDELGDLTRAFNTMRAALQQAGEELQEINASLEQRVARRTRELEEANAELLQEIGERQRAEIALRASEARMRAITRAVPDLLCVLDEDGRYVEVLSAQERPFSSAALKGRLLSEVHPAEQAQQFLDIIRQALATGQIQVAEYELEVSGRRRWFESRTAPVEVWSGDRLVVVVIARDITLRKATEARLRQAQKMEAIGHLTGGVAHDFNNLLAIIQGNLELLQEQLGEQAALQDLVRRALAAADRGASLTQRLLAFARQQPLRIQPVAVNALVAGMLELLQRTLGEHIEVRTALPAGLPAALVDPAQLETALLNLVVNARDAMPQGGLLTIETARCRLDEDYAARADEVQPGWYVVLAVSDTGTGMPAEVAARAFEPFFTTKGLGKGSGLGLSMVYGLMKQSHGHATLYSEVGRGTTVRLYLPQAAAAADTPESDEPAPLPQGRQETVLVVEDDPDVRELAVTLVNSLGYCSLAAADAGQALEWLAERPDIVLLFTDIVLPGGMNGVELAQEARRRRPQLQVLYTSGYTEHALVQQGCLPAGADMLAKPYRRAGLAEKFRSLLEVAPVADDVVAVPQDLQTRP